MDEWSSVRAERLALADDLAGLTRAQWDAPSLCGDWKVRDVVGHLIWSLTFTNSDVFRRVLSAKGNFGVVNAQAAIDRARDDTGRLFTDFRALADNRRTPPGVKAVDLLNDTIVHGQDIRRPLGLTRQFPASATLPCLQRLKKRGYPFRVKPLISGLQLVATDVDWSHGTGPEVRGRAEALLLAMTARPVAFSDLAGDGVAEFGARVAKRNS